MLTVLAADPATATSVTATIVAIATGAGAIVTAIGGVLLAIRTVRSRERMAAQKETDQIIGEMAYVEDLLAWERSERVDVETWAHQMSLDMARANMPIPPPPMSRPRPKRSMHKKDDDGGKQGGDDEPDEPGTGGAEDSGDRVPDGGDTGGNVHRFRRRSSG
jgi:hypothetical protein